MLYDRGFGLPNMEWNRRIAIEKELNRDPNAFRFVGTVYDESSNFLIYPTPVGINVIFSKNLIDLTKLILSL